MAPPTTRRLWILTVVASSWSGLLNVDCFTPISRRPASSPFPRCRSSTGEGYHPPRQRGWSAQVGTSVRHEMVLKAAPALTAGAGSSLPGVVWFALVHVLGGLSPLPFVVGAVRKPKGVDPVDKNLKGWYSRIALPSFTPPNGIFAPMWMILYATMGISLHMVLKHPKMTAERQRMALMVWGVHYLSNLTWAPIFFGLKRLRASLWVNGWLVTSLLLWMALIGHFLPSAALLLAPYLAWLVFATILNFAIVKLNPTRNGYNEAQFQDDLIKIRQRAADYADGK